MSDAHIHRDAILAANLASSSESAKLDQGSLYIPYSHIKALRLDAHVVVGGRGVGKSFWTSALQSQSLRSKVGRTVSGLKDLDIHIGHGNADSDAYPNIDVFGNLNKQNIDPFDIWRAVILRWIASKSNGITIPTETWKDTTEWLRARPEEAVRLITQPRAWRGMIIFDALDRTSTDWRHMDQIARGLLRAVLWLKAQNGLYGKVFLRSDQAQRDVFNFTDASKLLATKAELSWSKHDLHGLLWQRLINAPDQHGLAMRAICPAVFSDGVWLLAEVMRRETGDQQAAFAKIAGPWMGNDRRRGVPYHWSVNHLADGQGNTSPRSFLAAISEATDDSLQRYPEHPVAIHYESIKRGIQQASGIRVSEIAEDYGWVRELLKPLRGQLVPCTFDEIADRWQTEFPGGPSSITSERLPPQHTDGGWVDIRRELEHLGVLETRPDDRIDMPDLYRVGFGLGRKGGIKARR
jgi:hypothetical protein